MTTATAKPNQVRAVKCPCGHKACSYYGLSDGSFHQGTGWDQDTAQFYADARNVYHETGLTPRQLVRKMEDMRKAWRKTEARRAELLAALEGILSIGKRDMSNPKYDGFFDTARAAIASASVQAKGGPA